MLCTRNATFSDTLLYVCIQRTSHQGLLPAHYTLSNATPKRGAYAHAALGNRVYENCSY